MLKLTIFSSLIFSFCLIAKEKKIRTEKIDPLRLHKRELLQKIVDRYKPDAKANKKLENIILNSKFISQGNPSASKYAMTKKECLAKKTNHQIKGAEKICKDAYMAPLYDPKKEKMKDAKVCIDQMEFPNIPCEYPVVWTLSKDADAICKALGKRLCDAHEWEAGCAGEKPVARYAFDKLNDKMDMETKQKVLRTHHNKSRKILWSYGKKQDHSKCATSSRKSKVCNMDHKPKEFETCGSNFYPTGAFPECKSSLGVYDIHGNAAEQMNLPFSKKELASKGGLGVTELKGSWYIFNNFKAHQDDCHWRAPDWHLNTVQKSNDQHNHLGFRCCANVD